MPDLNRKTLNHYFQEPGLGVPLIVTRRRPEGRDFLGPVSPSPPPPCCVPRRPAASKRQTVRRAATRAPLSPGDVIGVFDLYDPLHVTQVSFGAASQNLARDISAPLALVAEEVKRENWQHLFRPGQPDAAGGIRMLEPYQRGKIPVIFVHGLASDRFTWIQMIDELRSVPWVNERCQIWTFQYATGQPFLASGAEMRQQLRDIAGAFDPQGTDRALGNTMLVGHSMGGLVSKLQVTYSGNVLWDQIASKPFSEVTMQPQDRERIYPMFFFEPLPGVSRVVFIGTPHQGSFWAVNVWGRLGSSLVKMPKDRTQVVETLVRNNPDVFAKLLRKGFPPASIC